MAELDPAPVSTVRTREGDLTPEDGLPAPPELGRLTAEGSAVPAPSPPAPPAGGGAGEEKKKETSKEAPKESAKETAKEAAKEGTKEAPKEGAPAAEPEPLPIPIARLVPKLKKSAKLFEEAKKFLPNGSSSLIRTASYDPCPPFIAKGKGARIWDEDGNEYLDYNLAYGVLINGHAPEAQVKAIQ